MIATGLFGSLCERLVEPQRIFWAVHYINRRVPQIRFLCPHTQRLKLASVQWQASTLERPKIHGRVDVKWPL